MIVKYTYYWEIVKLEYIVRVVQSPLITYVMTMYVVVEVRIDRISLDQPYLLLWLHILE